MIAVIDKGGFLYEINVSGTADILRLLLEAEFFILQKAFIKAQRFA